MGCQQRFKSPAIQCREYLLSCGRDIEGNPLEPGLVSEPWQYAWSSARTYALGHADPLPTEAAEYGELAEDSSGRQERWRAFLLADDAREEAVRRGNWAVGMRGSGGGCCKEQGRSRPRRRGRLSKTAS